MTTKAKVIKIQVIQANASAATSWLQWIRSLPPQFRPLRAAEYTAAPMSQKNQLVISAILSGNVRPLLEGDLRDGEPDTVRCDRNEERSSVDEEESEVSGREYNGPPRDEEEETDSVSVGVVGVVVVTVG